MTITKCPPGVAVGAENAWPQKVSTRWDAPRSLDEAWLLWKCRNHTWVGTTGEALGFVAPSKRTRHVAG
jgi:hypothetical protein